MPDTVYSPGLEGVIAGESSISTVSGGLQYRGYSIEDLAEHASFEEVAYLLLHDQLPTNRDLEAFTSRLAAAAQVPPPLTDLLAALPHDVAPMTVMRTAASVLGHWDVDVADNSHDANVRKAERLLAQLPVAMAAHHRLRHGQAPIAFDPTRGIAENCLRMLFDTEPSPEQIRAMDVSLVLYAEHEFNASTFTARVVVSTLSDLHSAITAAIGALKGPLHGGANELVIQVLEDVGSPERAKSWVREALAEKRRIMGFGHRVYKEGDPRAEFLKPLCKQLAAQVGRSELEATADVIENAVRGEKKLPPNLDWPSARLYHYLGLPIDLYTPLFVLSRTAGWCAHVIEQLDANRLIRPRANYTGPQKLPWVPLAER